MLVLCFALIAVAGRFAPDFLDAIFRDRNTEWFSERFSVQLEEKNEWVVLSNTITGRETVSQSALLLGTVQEVSIPYAYSVSFVINLSQCTVAANGDTMEVYLPAPEAAYSKLTVDDDNIEKRDFLRPLTHQRYAEIINELESKLYLEASTSPENLEAAWDSAVKNMEKLYLDFVQESGKAISPQIKIIRISSVLPTFASPSTTVSP